MSTPQPSIPFWLRPFIFITHMLPGIILLAITIGFLVVFLRALLADPNALLGLMLIGLGIGILWFLWMQLPLWLRRPFNNLVSRSRKRRDD